MAYTYAELDALLVGHNKHKKVLANHTVAERGGPGRIAIRLHKTHILIYMDNGQVRLDSSGWRTITTRDRINRYLPYDWMVGCDKGIWYLRQGGRPNTGQVYASACSTSAAWTFEDGITVSENRATINGLDFPAPTQFNAGTLKAVAKLKKRIKEFARYCATKLPLEQPGSGDCWICCADRQDHRMDTDHLESHMKEKYVVPRLVYNAIAKHANAPAYFSYAFTPGQLPPDFVIKTVERAIYKWMLAAYGLEVR